MGYWATTLTGLSLQLVGDLNPDGSEMLWGDSPADAIGAGIDNLIKRLKDELGRYPTLEEVDAARPDAPEMIAAIAKATAEFTEDIGRPPTEGEIAAGLAFSDTEISLDSIMRSDIGVGDTVRWPVMKDVGCWSEVDYYNEGVVDGISQSIQTSMFGTRHVQKYYDVRDAKGLVWGVRFGHATKVLPGDESLEEANARRLRHRSKEFELTDDDVDEDELNGGFGLLYNRSTVHDRQDDEDD